MSERKSDISIIGCKLLIILLKDVIELDAIDLMVEEHKHIKRMLSVIRRACIGIMHGREIDFNDFKNMIDFVRNYADNHHHGKEEKILFNRMIELGGAAEKLVRFGMLVEHDFGRLYMQGLEEALERVRNGDEEAKVDVIANAVSYTHLLNRHIDKEDNIAYPYGKRELASEVLDNVNAECEALEAEAEKSGNQEKYLKMLEMLEQKYVLI